MLKTIAILFTGTLFCSALLTPFVYTILNNLFSPFPWPFSRVFDRVAMAVAVVFLLVYVKELKTNEIKALLLNEIKHNPYKVMLYGSLLSFVPAIVTLYCSVPSEGLVWAGRPWNFYIKKFFLNIPGAFLIGLVEECFFRGVLLRSLRSKYADLHAVTLTSLLYAIVHFIAPIKTFAYTTFDFFAGFKYMAEIFERLFMPGIGSAMAGLFLVGAVLSSVKIRTNSLLLCVGLHAGWIMALKMSVFTTSAVAGFQFSSGIGQRYFLVAAPLTWLSIIGVGGLVFFLKRKEEYNHSAYV
jgi:membrane protease YdiL (CAAX protease family)